MNPGTDFIHKWRERWPEWGIAEVFLPPAQRPLVAAWWALLQEFTLAAWAGHEAAPGLAKLAWWQDELNGWDKGRRRHPLGESLLTQPVPWAQLARALNGLSISRDVVPDNTTAAVDLAPLAQTLMAAEARLFEPDLPPAPDHSALLLDLLAEQTLLRGDPAAATRLLAEYVRLRDTARPRPRRLQSAILSGRLRQLQKRQSIRPVPTWRTLLRSWRAARGAS